MTATTVSFMLNGEEVQVQAPPRLPLLSALRNQLGVTSMKAGCAPQGTCGACTVLLDGRPIRTCTMKAAKAAGREVTTIEGLDPDLLDLYVEAFTRGGGSQCGFCTPGILLQVHALLERDPDPDQAAVSQVLGAHVCRCTGWHGVFRSVKLAAALRRMGDRRPTPPVTGGIGRSVDRYGARELVLGRRPFIGDVTRPGMLHGALVFAPCPRGVLLEVDISRALSMPGVEAVVTAEDFPGDRMVGLMEPDWPPMVAPGEEIRCVGDVVAAVAAKSPELAREAAREIHVKVRELPGVFDLEEAAEDPARVLSVTTTRRGDVEAAFQASHAVVEETFSTQWIDHAFLEPEAALASPRGEGGLHVLSCGQGIFSDRTQLSKLFALEPEQVLVEHGGTGGAFGGREDLNVQPHAALLAHRTGRPVRVVLTMAESLQMHVKRHPFIMRFKVGADADGLITAIQARILGDTGGHASTGAAVLERAAGHAGGPYRVASVDVEARAILTNNPTAGAMRGFGANQVAFALEGCVDRLASRLGLDPLEIRARNVLREGDAMITGQVMGPGVGILATIEAARPHYERARRAGLHVGVACGFKNVGLGNGYPETGQVVLEVESPDSVVIYTGFTEMGQGHTTVLTQFAAELTGLPSHMFRVACDTTVELDVGMTTSSRATFLAGHGMRRAVALLSEALDEVGRDLGALSGRRFHGVYRAPETGPPRPDGALPTHFGYSYATQLAIVDRGGRLVEVVAVHDVGRVVNPLQCRGQVEGGVHMGIGQALTEELVVKEGRPDTRYRRLGVVTAADMPAVTVIFVEHPEPEGPWGVKGIGEIGLVPTAPAIAGALQAHDGNWRTSLPMGPAPLRSPSRTG